MTVKKIRAAHVPTIGVESFIGEPGTLFYDHETGELRIYTGAPGGKLVYGSVSLPTDGTEGQVLAVHGDGSYYWTDMSAGTTSTVNVGNFVFDGNNLYNLNGGSFNNGDLSHGSTAGLFLPPNGTGTVQLSNIYGNLVLSAGADHVSTASWTFGSDGSLTIPGGISGTGDFLIESSVNGYNSGLYVNVNTSSGSATILYGTQNVVVRASNNSLPFRDWTFGVDGSLTFPDETSQSTAWTGSILTSQISDYSPTSYTAGKNITINGNELSVDAPVYLGNTELAGTYSNVQLQLDADIDSFAETVFQNHNSGTNASTDLVIMNDIGDEFNNFIDLGINSSNYSQPTYSVTGPGDGYLFVNGANLILGTQSPNTVIRFHAGGTQADAAGMELSQYLLNINRRVELNVSTPSPLRFLTRNASTNVEASSLFQAENDLGDFVAMGVNSSQRIDGNIGAGESFLYPSSNGGIFHIGNHSAIHFYTNASTGYAGTPTFQLNASDDDAILDAHLNPHTDNEYDLGDATHHWRSLYVSTSGIYINNIPITLDQNNHLTVNGSTIIGQKGADGTPGTSATIHIGTVATGLPGSRVIVTNTGTSQNVYLNFTIPEGSTGTQGLQGIQGVIGPKGDKGDMGPQGNTGTQGIQGPVGDTGAQGISLVLIGSTDTVSVETVGLGQAGQGWIGTSTGHVYFWNTLTTLWEDIGPIVGPEGPRGPQGVQGDKGDQGIQGNPGIVPGWSTSTGFSLVPDTDNLQDIGTPSQRVRHIYVGPGSITVGNSVITESNTGKLVLPGLTRGTGYSLTEVEDTADQTYSFGSTPTIIDNAYFAILNNSSTAPQGYVAPTYSVDQLDGEGFIDGISIDSQGTGLTQTEIDLMRSNMWAYVGSDPDPIGNWNNADWQAIPFRVRSEAGDVEYEFNTQNGIAVGVIDGEGSLTNDSTVTAIGFNEADGFSVTELDGGIMQVNFAGGGGGSGLQVVDGVLDIANGFQVETYDNGSFHLGAGGNDTHGANSIAIGNNDVGYDQGDNSIAIGYQAGWADSGPIGPNSIAIGAKAAYSSAPAHSITLNATGNALNPIYQGFFVKPVREDTGNVAKVVYYNTATGELSYANDNTGDLGFSANVMYAGTGPESATGFINLDNGENQAAIGTNNNMPLLISVNEGGGAKNWTFGTDGSITFPDGTIQDTAFIAGGNANTGDLVFNGRSMYNPLSQGVNIWDGGFNGPYNGEIVLFNDGVIIFTNNETKSWWFDNSGDLTLPTGGDIKRDGVSVLGAGGTSTIAVSATAPDVALGKLWYNTVDGRVYVGYGGSWVDASPTVVPNPETYLGNITIDGSTLNINGSTLTINNSGTLLVNGGEVIGSGGGNIYGATLTASDADPGTTTGTLWFNTIEGRTYLKYNDQWVDVNPTVVPLPSTYLDEITIDGSTINMNGSTLAISTAGVLLVNGAEVSGQGLTVSDGGSTTVSGVANMYITAIVEDIGDGDVGIVINKLFRNNHTLELNANGELVGDGADPNVYIQTTSATTSTWVFGTDGIFTLPADTPIIKGGGTGTDVSIVATDNITTATWVFDQNGNITLPNNAGNRLTSAPGVVGLFTDADNGSWNGIEVYNNSQTNVTNQGQVVVIANNNEGTAKSWTFGADGKLTIPDQGTIYSTTNLKLSVFDNMAQTQQWTLDGTGTLTFPTNGGILFDNSGSSSISGMASIQFADSTIQTTAWNDTAFHASMESYDGFIDINTATIGVGGLTVNGPVTFNSTFEFLGTATVISSNSGTFYGDIYGVGALYAGVAGYSPLPSTVIQSSANVNAYIQNNFQNINNGVQASTEWVATANNGDDSNNYLDMGIAGSAWDGSQSNSVGTAAQANDSWIYAQGSTAGSTGGNLILGTIKNGKSIKFLAGSTGSSSVVATINSTGITINSGTLHFADGTIQNTAAISFNTSTLVANAVSANTAAYATTFNTSTLVANAVSANSVVGGIGVSSITAGTGTVVSSATGAVTVWATPWTGGTVSGTATVATFVGTATATSTSTGAVQVQGGLGVGGNLWANTVYSNDSYFRGATGNGYIQLSTGGLAYFLSDIVLNGATSNIKGPGGYSVMSVGTPSGSGNNGVKFLGTATVAGTVDATSSATGSLIVSGGVGIAKNTYVGGYVVQQALPAFRVYGANSTTYGVGTTLTATTFIVDYNQGNHLTTSTGIFTAPVAGLYQTNLVARAYSNAGIASQIAVVKTYAGTTTNVVACMIEWAANTTVNHLGASTVIKLAVGDTLSAKVLLGSAQFDANDNWSVAFLG